MGTAFVFVLLMDPDSGPAQTYANTLGIVSAIVPVFVWTPQLYTTYKLKGPGSLSLTMQVIQTPGSFIQAFFQALLDEDAGDLNGVEAVPDLVPDREKGPVLPLLIVHDLYPPALFRAAVE